MDGLRDAFDHAAALQGEERRLYLAGVYAVHPEWKDRLEALLRAHDEPTGPLDRPLMEEPQPSQLLKPEQFVGQRLGAYVLEEQIGRGGMGLVFRASRSDDQYRKQVAIKIMAPSLAAQALRARFVREKQILAQLEHPYICGLIDAGMTSTGLPYIVMDLVQGVPLLAHCERRRPGLEARLHLFVKICAAVHHAHQNLVLHRDLKPGNILVDDSGIPKLLDFGIAKLLGDPGDGEETLTQTGIHLMTPDYASPEQIRGGAVNVASDVYSLGIILYEMLTGRKPYPTEGANIAAVLEAVLERDPVRPSLSAGRPLRTVATGVDAGAAQALRGDLDAIILKAIDKDPPRRYPSVQALAEDLQRFLDGKAVRARPATAAYIAGKFVRKNPWLTAAASLAVLALGLGTVTTLWQARIAIEQARMVAEQRERAEALARRETEQRKLAEVQRARAEEERDRANRLFQDLRKLANSLVFEFHDAIVDLPGATRAREALARRGVEYLNALASQTKDDPALQAELAAAYGKVGDVQGSFFAGNKGDWRGALESHRKARSLLDGLLQAHPAREGVRRDLAVSWLRSGDVHVKAGQAKEAVRAYQRAIATFQPILASRDTTTLRAIAMTHSRLCTALPPTGDAKLGLQHCQAALAQSAKLVQRPGAQFEDFSLRAMQLAAMAEYLRFANRTAEAIPYYRDSLSLMERLVAEQPNSTNLLMNLAGAIAGQSFALMYARPSGETVADLNRALGLLRRLASMDALDVRVRKNYAFLAQRQAQFELKARNEENARRLTAESLDIQKRLAVDLNSSPDDWNDYADGLVECKIPELKNPSEALAFARRAVEASNGQNVLFLHTLAWANFEAGNREEAIRIAESVLNRKSGFKVDAGFVRMRLANDLKVFRGAR